ncbi:lytic transglycosylase domain-containing protein [Methylocystis sp. MJC1]|nr:lytic transglycosylase domain-containing protein [Methylocystis sp. MJC1]
MSSAPLQVRYSLGPDPFNPHDNIHAGAAYLSELLDRYGERGFLATYNAGPKRCEDYLRGRSLPTETTDYVAQLSSELHFNELPTRYVTLPPDAAHSQIFVACEASNDRAYKGSTDSVEDIPRTEKAVRHLLLSAQRDVSIFATDMHHRLLFSCAPAAFSSLAKSRKRPDDLPLTFSQHRERPRAFARQFRRGSASDRAKAG